MFIQLRKIFLSKKVLLTQILVCFIAFFFITNSIKAQQIFFTEDFESDTLDDNWQKVNGNWQIIAADALKVVAGKNIGQHILSCDSPGYLRLKVDIDTSKTRSIKLNFTYYAKTKGPSAIVEIEFLRKGYKDGYKGKWMKIILPVKGSWAIFQKNLKVPAEANSIWVTFSEQELKNNATGSIYIDNITMTDID